jgi:hypothetical protein
MASALLYYQLLQRQLGFTRDRRTTNYLICDNEGLLTRIEQAVGWNYTTPNVTLSSEWDIESVILDIYKAIKTWFVFVHVKSHQDDKIPLASLSLESRLNVEADRLATEYMQEDPIRRPHAALFPSAKAQQIIKRVIHHMKASTSHTNGSRQYSHHPRLLTRPKLMERSDF